jgi:hypothetical protein
MERNEYLEKMCSMSRTQLFSFCKKELAQEKYSLDANSDYIFAHGSVPVLVIAVIADFHHEKPTFVYTDDVLYAKNNTAFRKECVELHENRSVWIAQREGRTKDGNDATNPGVLKMLGMASEDKNVMEYFKKIKIVPVSISYEYDPTDVLKMPQLMAEANNEIYVKEKNEDFQNILSGVLGQKKRIHIHIGKVIDSEIDTIVANEENANKQVLALAQAIDDAILTNYKLWPTNFIAYDILHKTNQYSHLYTENEKSLFERRLEMRIDHDNPVLLEGFLSMYSNPVVNKLKYTDAL